VLKLICFVKRNPSLSVDDFHAHWRGPHAQLILDSPAAVENVVRYEQNHRAVDDYARGGDYDGVAIQWYPSMRNFAAMIGDPQYQASVGVDEQELLDVERLVFIFTEPEEVVIPGPEPRDGPMTKLICMVKRRPGMTSDDFHRHWRQVHSPLNCDTPSIARYFVRYERNHRARRDYEREDPDFDGAAVEWYPSVQAFYDMISEPEYRDVIAPDEQRFLDRDHLEWLLTDKEETIIG
jgi:uncharacterized protein (TIGR02118 family)